MSFELAIHPLAESEWSRLDASVKQRFKQKLAKERLQTPRIAKDALHGLPDCYKIKITTPQFRLAYHVSDEAKLLTILAVSSRDDVYELLSARRNA
jgi:mRNA interferase RelE/StbE